MDSEFRFHVTVLVKLRIKVITKSSSDSSTQFNDQSFHLQFSKHLQSHTIVAYLQRSVKNNRLDSRIMKTPATLKYGLFDVSNEILYNIISHLDMATTICSRSANTFIGDIFPPPTLEFWINVPVYDTLVRLL